MEKGNNIFESIYEFIKGIVKNTKESLEKLRSSTGTSSDLSSLKKAAEENKPGGNESNNDADASKDKVNSENNEGDSKEKIEESKNNKESTKENLSIEKLKSLFEKNANNLSVEKIDGKDFFEVSYVDKSSGSKVKGIIPFNWNGDSNIYMPGDRSGIAETMKQKNFKQEITDKDSKKARFIFEGDADKINGTQKSARYNNVIKNFENMISPIKLAGENSKITIIGHSRAGATVNKLIGNYGFINDFIILDGTYGVYKNVMQSKIPGKIFYTNGGGTAKYISNYKNKSNVEVSGEYAKLGHEAIVPKVLFDTPSTKQDLFT